MINDDDRKPVKKPVPLPRKSLIKQNKSPCLSETRKSDNDDQERKYENNFVRDDWKSASESFVFEKKRLMKNEVNKFEKSVKNIILRRRSGHSKSQNQISGNEHKDALPDESIFLNISFNSPLSEGNKADDTQSSSYLDFNYDCVDSSPPPYPPPDPPDESVYDHMKRLTCTDAKCVINNSCNSYSNSLGATSGASENENVYDIDPTDTKKYSESLLCTERKSDDRYTLIYDSAISNYSKNEEHCLRGVPQVPDPVLDAGIDVNSGSDVKPLESHIKYIIHLFDPLQKNEENSAVSLVTNKRSDGSKPLYSDFGGNSSASYSLTGKVHQVLSPDGKMTEIIPPNLKEGQYGKIRKPTNPTTEPVKPLPKKSVVEPPPIPPRLTYSFTTEAQGTKGEKLQNDTQMQKSEQEKDLSATIQTEDKTKESKSVDVIQWSSLKRVAKKVADNIENRTSYLSLAGRKSKNLTEEFSQNALTKSKSAFSIGNICQLPQNFSKHSGVMYRPGGIERWGVLSQRKLTMFANKDSPDVKETVPMDNVLSIQATQNKISSETTGIHCFEISTTTRNQLLLFGVPSISERHIWMRKLVESIGPGFSAKLSMDYTKAGWCYAKESVTCVWAKYCILLHHRTLYLSSENGSVSQSDLRKARKISLQTEGFTCEKVTEKGPFILVDLQDKTLYLQMDYDRETRAWETALMGAALSNGPSLCEQQLTKDDIPTIVDKCLNFVHTNGSFSEGIYRRNGSNRTVSQLLASFRYNAWAVQLSKDTSTEFDVSSVLKRFFRDLPEPLIVPDIQEELGKILGMTDVKEKCEQYKIILKKLPAINYLTAKKLLCHLHFIDKQKDKNLMGAENLAAIWGPTILQVQEQVALGSDCFKMETLIVNDLICYYPDIFDVEKTEVEREMKILQLLENYHMNSNTLNKKPSGELKIWVYLYSAKNADNCVNVSINPQKTAEEVCKELSVKINEPVHSLCLEEVICSGYLTRPLNHSEKVLDTVLRWSYWDEADRKDNCLVLTKNDLFQRVVQFGKGPVMLSEQFKFADQKSRTFKSYQFEFSQAKLICYKDKLCSQKVGEWKVEDIVWYFGHEPKRPSPSKWAITFIEKQSLAPRTKEKIYFGNTISGSSEEQKLKLVTALLLAQYSNDILPALDLME